MVILLWCQQGKEDNKLARPIENSERINTFVTPEVLQKLKEIAQSKGMSVSGLIRMIILDYISKW